VGSIITGRIDKIKFNDEKPTDDDFGKRSYDSFSINLNLKKKNLLSHEGYVDDNEEIHEDDMININFKTQEDQIQNQQKHMI